jgi:eukaryotic-like serine/threonine-protein kinase
MTNDNLPYLVMEYVEGEQLDKYCDEHKLSIEERLELFRKVCAAVSHAHQNLVVHRDLKPSNILITKNGEPKLLDFGIAKLLNPELSSQTIVPTATLLRLMTPEYASPEQIRGLNITTASDTYSLGVILYKLLTGQNPHHFQNSTPKEIERVICESEPTAPSRAISNLRLKKSELHSPSGGSLSAESQQIPNPKSLRGDLDNIILTALRKEPERRYKSVAELSEDIHRYLTGLPVAARPNTFRYRTEKFIQRNKISVAAASIVFIVVISGLFVSLWQAAVAREQRDLARAEKLKAERVSQFLSAALAYSDPSATAVGTNNRRDATINQMLDEFAPRIETELADQPDIRATLQRTVGLAYISQLRYAEADRYLNAALDTQLNIFGETHPETAYTLLGTAILQVTKGDYSAAEEKLEKTISIYRRQPLSDSIYTKVIVDALVTLGDIRWSRADYVNAGLAFTEAIDHARQLQGRDRESITSAKTGLGLTSYSQGRLDEAVTILREAANEYRSLPHLRWRLAIALNHLSQVLIWKGEYDEAITLLRESETINLEIWGGKDYGFARSLWLQVYALCFKGDCAAAEKPLIRTEQIIEKYYPDNKTLLANNLTARNLYYNRTGRPAEGEICGRKSIELYQSAMSKGAVSVTLARVTLAESLMAQKKYDEAERVLLEAHKDASQMQGAEHWRTKQVARELTALYELTGKKDLAQQYK